MADPTSRSTGGGPAPAGGSDIVAVPARPRARRNLLTTAALAAVLAALVGFTLWGTLDGDRAAKVQDDALRLDDRLSDAAAAIAIEQLALRSYQLEPSTAARARFAAAADAADRALARAATSPGAQVAADTASLRAQQASFRAVADQLIARVSQQDPSAAAFDQLQVEPAYFTLQNNINSTSAAYHARAKRLVADYYRTQTRVLVMLLIGFVIGLGLVALIWRMVLGYQHLLARQANASEHLALHDPLTGLPNRSLLRRRLDAALHEGDGGQVALMVIDLNDFKTVNDTLGHPAGDELLAATAARLRAAVPATDTVARLGGDEFAVLVPSLTDQPAAKRIADRLTDALRRDFALTAGRAAITASIGLAVGPADTSRETLTRQADAAMYRAKTTGEAIAAYDPARDIEQPDRMALFADLRALLDDGDPGGQLTLYYQPRVRIRDATVTSVRAHPRWHHPDRGLLTPQEFLTIAESGRLDIPLTCHLLRLVIAQAAAWQVAGQPLAVALPVPPRCLLEQRFADRLHTNLDACGLAPALLRLHLTDTGTAGDQDTLLATLRRVRAQGVALSIDAFDRRCTPLTQLRRLDADELTIHPTLTRSVATDPIDATVTRGVIDLAHHLDMHVIADGIDDRRTLATLRELNCDQVQGDPLAPPVPAADLSTARLRAEQRTREWAPDATAG